MRGEGWRAYTLSHHGPSRTLKGLAISIAHRPHAGMGTNGRRWESGTVRESRRGLGLLLQEPGRGESLVIEL